MAVLRGPAHRFELTNEAYERLVGARALVGRTIREAFDAQEGVPFFDLLDRLYATGESFVGQGMEFHLRDAAGAPQRCLLVKATKTRSWQQAAEQNGWTPAMLTRNEFSKFVEDEFASLRATMTKAGMI